MRYRAMRKRRYDPSHGTIERQVPVLYVQELVGVFDSLSDTARTLILGTKTRIEEDDFCRDKHMLYETSAEEDKAAVNRAVRMISMLSHDDRFDFSNSAHFCAAMVLFLRGRYDIKVNI